MITKTKAKSKKRPKVKAVSTFEKIGDRFIGKIIKVKIRGEEMNEVRFTDGSFVILTDEQLKEQKK
jgi:hypothetical protein